MYRNCIGFTSEEGKWPHQKIEKKKTIENHNPEGKNTKLKGKKNVSVIQLTG